MRIYLIRHGLTELGEAGCYQGSLDTPLSPKGRQALRAAEQKPGVICVSPLLRAKETAGLLFPGVPQTVVPDLGEMHFGSFEGRSWKDMENDRDYREWVDGNCEGQCPGGEDRASFSRRVCRAFSNLVDTAAAEGKEELVIVAHGGTQMAVLERWGGSGKAYYEWQTPCGKGWLLDTDAWPDRLTVLRELDYTKEGIQEIL